MKKTPAGLLAGALIAALCLVFLSLVPRPTFKVLAVCSVAKDHVKMIASARPWLQKMAKDNNFTIDITDDTAAINDKNLSRYQVFLHLHLAPFDMSYQQQAALQKFIESGKGWVGIHAAGLTGKDFLAPGQEYWQWFEGFMGSVIYSPHPRFQKGTVIVEDRNHPVTRGLPERFEISDEWYEFNKSPRANVHVLATADEASYKQNKPMGDHPIIWINENFHRMVYIGVGHDSSVCSNANYTMLVRNALIWAAESKK